MIQEVIDTLLESYPTLHNLIEKEIFELFIEDDSQDMFYDTENVINLIKPKLNLN